VSLPNWLDWVTIRIAHYIRRAFLINDAGSNIYLKREDEEDTGVFNMNDAFGLAAISAHKVESYSVETIPVWNCEI